MKKKTYNKIKIIIQVSVAISVFFTGFKGYYFLPIIVIPLSIAILIYLHKKVKEVLVDERIIKIVRAAAFSTFQLMIIILAITGTTLIGISINNIDKYIKLLIIGYTLCSVGSIFGIIYLVLYKLYSRKI